MSVLSAIKSSHRKSVAALGLFALLLASLPVNWHFISDQSPWDSEFPRSANALIAGSTTAAVTDIYNKNFLLRETGIDVFGTIDWVLFREGRPGVLAGSDGWLFTTEEFQSDPQSTARVEHAARFVAQVRDRLADKGIDLVVALVPAKASIYPEKLGRYRLPAEPAGRYQEILKLLGDEDVETVDLRPALIADKAKEQAFLRTDTHWTPGGATAAAEAIANHLRGRDLGEEKMFVKHDLPAAEHSGDLLRFIRVASIAKPLLPAPDQLNSFDAEDEGGGSLLGDEAVPIALVGTSYSANTKWSFEAALKIASQHDVLNVAEEGEGPFTPMTKYLASDSFKDAPPKLVVWEIPERFVDDDYGEEAFRLP